MTKVPQVVLMFWLVKILATTVGETGGDAVSMTLKLGYGFASLVFLALFGAALAAQLASTRYHPLRYWLLVIATTTVGTTMSDYLDRTAGLGYVTSSILLFLTVLAVLFAWLRTVGRIRFENITTRREEIFYWTTILASNTLGTALGDYVASGAGFGFERGALIFSCLLALVAALHFWARKIPASILFWSAYVLTRPLGATLGDTLTKPFGEGGLALGRISSSAAIAVAMMLAVLAMTRREQRSRQASVRGSR